MLPDFIKDVIENSWCGDCEYSAEYKWSNGTWCVGQLRKNYPPCDVIRFCDIKEEGGINKHPIHVYEYSPDEAFTLSYLLTKVANTWLLKTDTYFKFKVGWIPTEKLKEQLFGRK